MHLCSFNVYDCNMIMNRMALVCGDCFVQLWWKMLKMKATITKRTAQIICTSLMQTAKSSLDVWIGLPRCTIYIPCSAISALTIISKNDCNVVVIVWISVCSLFRCMTSTIHGNKMSFKMNDSTLNEAGGQIASFY